MRGAVAGGLLVWFLLGLLLAAPANAGDPEDPGNFNPAPSGSGRYVAFDSMATNLPGNDAVREIFVRDLRTGKTKLVSKTSAGDTLEDHSYSASISGSGRYVAFESGADNLPGDDGHQNVYVHDRRTGKTKLVSKSSAGVPADRPSFRPALSRSGRYIGFASSPGTLPGVNAFQQIYVHDRKTGKTRLVSKTSDGAPGDGFSYEAAISSSGRHVAFYSDADNLPGDDAFLDVYVHDRKTGNTRLVSKTSDGAVPDQNSFTPSISSSGRHVSFMSQADNLPGEDGTADVYIHDRKTGKTRLVSKSSAGAPADVGSTNPSISGSGRYVAFSSQASNLPGGDGSTTQVFVHDRKTGTTRLVSQTSAGTAADDGCFASAISRSGRVVSFYSFADNLPGADLFSNVYARDRKTGKTKLVSRNSAGEPVNG